MTTNQSFIDRHHFLLRRLHSLTGVVPIGVFMIVHLLTNGSIVWGLINAGDWKGVHAGAATFQHEVNFIHSLPALVLIEVLGLWLPLLFHTVLGLIYASRARYNNARYTYQSNWRYTLQRISGYVGVLFIFYHVATLRWGWKFLIPGGTEWSAEYAAATLAQALQGSETGYTPAGVAVSAFYMVGVSLLVFHLANGLWTAAITWGLTVSEASQKRWGYVCTTFGAGLMVLAWSAVIGFATLDPSAARAASDAVRGHTIEPRLGTGQEHPAGAGTPADSGLH